jgi:hypothetical protein
MGVLVTVTTPHAKANHMMLAHTQTWPSSCGICNSDAHPEHAEGIVVPCQPLAVPKEVGELWRNTSANVTIGGYAALTEKSTLKCAWGGTIQIMPASAGSQIENG